MRIPVIRGLIDRRILVNFRVDPDVLAKILPNPFRPQLAGGFGIAGICLIRLKQIRPRFLPSIIGIGSENAAHRIAVQWDVDGQRRTGVYIPRRDTSSLLNAMAGGRIFPGTHHRARFDIQESGDHFRVAMRSLDGSAQVLVDGTVADRLPDDSAFQSLADVSQFFQTGSLGYSANGNSGEMDGLELRTFNWQVEPLAIREVQSSFFDDRSLFPAGSVSFDCALLMRGIEHEWHSRDPLPYSPSGVPACPTGCLSGK